MSPLDANLCELKQIFYCHFLSYSENTYYTSPKPRAPFQPCRMIQASHPWISPLILKVYSPLLSHGEVLSPILHGQTILTQPLCLYSAFLPSCQQSKPPQSLPSPRDRISSPFFFKFCWSWRRQWKSYSEMSSGIILTFFPPRGFLNVSLQSFWNCLFYHYSLQYLLNLVIMIVLQFWSIGRHKFLATQFQPQNFICESFFFFFPRQCELSFVLPWQV